MRVSNAHTYGMPLNRHSPVPLWAQILADLRAKLAAGAFSEHFPSDVELVREYDVSRQTVREAVRHLQQEGVIERVRGHGTAVRKRPVEQSLGSLYSLYRSAEEQGFDQKSSVRFLELRENASAAQMLGCAPAEPLVYLERLRLLDGSPAMLDCSWLPARFARRLLNVDFQHTALYRELEERCGIHLDSGWERVTPILPTPTQRALLDLGSRVAAYGIERVACEGDLRVEWRHGVIRADRFEFVARWGDGRFDAAFEAPGEQQSEPHSTVSVWGTRAATQQTSKVLQADSPEAR